MRIGVIAVGVEDYEHPSFRRSDLRLKYAVDDVRAFVTYATAAWSGAAARTVIPLLNRKATRTGFNEAVANLSDAPPDLFVLYLSGHGARDADGVGWFCLADAIPGKPSLTGPVLDAALERIGARQTVLLLDCCYAAAVLAGSQFFSTLGPSIAKLFLCSARADQRAWEDDNLRHGIFSNVLINGLSSASPLVDAAGFVDIETSLFPRLCEQVPRLVFSKKGRQLQEPTKGGVSAGPTKFPTTSVRLLGRQISAYQAVRAGFLRWLRRAALIATIALVFGDLTLYHLAIGATGIIEVRSGLNFVDPLRRSFPGGIIETGINRDKLNPGTDDPQDLRRQQAVKLAEGRIWGFRVHARDRWTDRLLPLLKEPERQMTAVFFGENPQNDQESTDTTSKAPLSKDSPISPIVLARAALAGNNSALLIWQASFENDLPTAQDLNCHSDVQRLIDFTLLEPSPAVIAEDIRRLVLASVSDPTKAFDRLLEAVKIIDYRSFKGDQKAISLSEQTALVRAASYLRSRPGQPVEQTHLDQLRDISNTWCSQGANLLLFILSDQATRQQAEKGLVEKVLSFDLSKQGDALSPEQEGALNTLAAATEANSLSSTTIEDVVHIIEDDSRGVESVPQVVDWLRRIAAHQALPSSTVAFLQKELRRPAGEFDFHQLIAFTILARNARYLPIDTVSELVDWSRGNLATNGFVSDYAEAVGFLALVAKVGPEPAAVFAGRLVPQIIFPLEQEADTSVIRSNDFKHGVALGRLAQVMPLPGSMVDKLSSFAEARRGIPDYDQVILGLAAQGFQGKDLNGARDRLIADRSDARHRALDVDIAMTSALALDPNSRQATLDRLRASWSRESEPEIKIALGEIVAKLTLRTVGIRLSRPTPCECTSVWSISSDLDPGLDPGNFPPH